MIDQLYTYFGCKKQVIDRVWQAWDGVNLTCEPFAGTAIVSLSRPDNHSVSQMYLNDADCHISNVLRSVLYDPNEVIYHCAHPRIELDLHMIHDYLASSKPSLRELLGTAIDACDPVMAGLWVWGINNWLGSGWCSDDLILKTPDKVSLDNTDLDEFESHESTPRNKLNDSNKLTERIATGRQKFTRMNQMTERIATERNKLNHGNQFSERIATGRNKINHRNQLTERLTDSPRYEHISELVYNIYHKLRDAKILYGDFERVLTDSYLENFTAGVFMDPPYPQTESGYASSTGTRYDNNDDETFARALKWFIDHRGNPNYRIIFCCQESNLKGIILPDDIRKEGWSRNGGYSQHNIADRHTEVMLFSPACPNPDDMAWAL
jgi:site-specific DNA-adenine methylase